MKFSHSLQFNSVPEWSSKYIAYSQLKKLIYSLQKEKLYSSTPDLSTAASESSELQPLLDVPEDENSSYVRRFVQALDHEVKKIEKFYLSQETGLIANYNELKDDVHEYEQELTSANFLYPSQSLTGAVPTGGNAKKLRRRRLSSTSSMESNNSGLPLSVDSAPGAIVPPEQHRPSIEAQKSRSSTVNNNSLNLSNYEPLNPQLQHKVTLKKRLVMVYTQLSELKDFIDLNKTGFTKICKKFDKSLDTAIKKPYLKQLELKTHVFNPETFAKIEQTIRETIITYARLSEDQLPITIESISQQTGNPDVEHQALALEEDELVDYENAEKELSEHLRDHVVWERNTVWKDMMNLERKSQTAKTQDKGPGSFGQFRKKKLLIKETDDGVAFETGTDAAGKIVPPVTISDAVRLPLVNYVKLLLQSQKAVSFLFIFSIFLILLKSSPFDDIKQKNCFAILVFASLLWATETIPLFVTSLLIPFLVVVLPVLKDPNTDGPMSAKDSSQFILSTMWSSVIMLLLGGFTLAAALSKYNIAKVLSTYILYSAGTNPHLILLTNMGVALFVSMWVSNVAAPVLCYSIIQPMLRTLPTKSTYAKSLILGIALASNIGGMASPIASPQNIFAIGVMDPPPSWGEWFVVSIPVCTVSVVAIWLLLTLTFPLESSLKILRLHPTHDPFTLKQWFVSIISITTIVLWCLSNKLSGVLGEMGIISIIPLVVFFGTGLLTSDDFNNFMWTIVILAMGGTTLGKAVSSSGLLSTIASMIKESVEKQHIFVIVLIFGLVILTMATFVSHTVAAMIIVPLMGEIGSDLPGGDHSRLLIMVAAFLCSGAMGLPTSGFPNVTAISMIDEVGDRYLTVGTFIKRGVPAGFITYFVVVTLGYSLMKLIGL
ncbi:SPX domain [Nakaseomyces glabratus]|nr:SPX domain [Nakaseomyces glabratus]KAH7590324.1 SPX domain [Nakaseomyces glabratus]KAJ9569010.1 low-affinity phosphate transporter [Nakaseomyces glabratus]KTB22937.1 Low-affinity phosphate transporter PHO91 [Nakaseomyces glabratus]KTB24244.1 Low-affinity phosphate transporter PHO91 [Nakaseomyces glabratus]